MNNIKWWHRIRMPDGTYTPGVCHHGPDGGDWPTKRFGMPEDLTGKKVLDIGAWDGFFSFEAERRGADLVVATDISSDVAMASGGNWGGTTGFKYAHKILGSKVEWRKLDITNPDDCADILIEFGHFDLIMCFGVLYHIKYLSDVIGAIEHMKILVNRPGTVLIETAGNDRTDCSIELRKGFAGDPTNYWYPSDLWVEHTFKETDNNARTELVARIPGRFTVKGEL